MGKTSSLSGHAAVASNTASKRKVAFALSMGLVTTGVISFALVALNVGFSPGFVATWLMSWAAGFVLVVPTILLLGPRLQAAIERVIP